MSVSGPAEVVRYGGSVDIGPVGLEAGQAGSITRLRIEAQPELGPWTPRAGWRSEAGTAARDRVASGGLGLSQGERLSAELGCERTFSDETLAGQWRQRNVGNLARAHLDWSPSAAYRLGAGGAYQDRRFALAGGDDWSQVLGDISGSATPRAGIQVQASLGQSHKRVQLRDEVFRYVGPNQGEYRLDSLSGEYFADPDGDYERVTVATGRFAATREWTGTGSADVSAWEPAALYGSYSRTQARAEGSTLTELAHGSARFVVREFASVVTPTLEYTGDDAQDNTVAGAGRASQSRRWSVELHSDRLPELETRLRGTLSRQEEARGGTGMNSLETGWRLEGQPVVGSRLRLEVLLALERQALARADVPAGLVLVGREVTLGRTTGIGARTRLRTSAGLVWRSANQTSVPFDVSLGRPVGLVPRLEVEYGHTFSDVLSATARYGFQNRPDRPAEHSFAAEMQARF
jgi:hypothetical protein